MNDCRFSMVLSSVSGDSLFVVLPITMSTPSCIVRCSKSHMLEVDLLVTKFVEFWISKEPHERICTKRLLLFSKKKQLIFIKVSGYSNGRHFINDMYSIQLGDPSKVKWSTKWNRKFIYFLIFNFISKHKSGANSTINSINKLWYPLLHSNEYSFESGVKTNTYNI